MVDENVLGRFAAAVVVALMGHVSQAGATEIVVSAASSLTNAFKEISQQYEAEHKDTKILLSFAASDVLLNQIINGAPVDVFASADQIAMNKAVDAGVIVPDSRRDFARNEVVMIVPVDDRHNITALADLSRDEITRVAFGNPGTVPVGRYTERALKEAGLWETAYSKQVLGQNVRQVLDYVSRGEVDAGFVFATDAAIMRDRVRVIQRLDSPAPVLYPIAVVNDSSHQAEAAGFLEYMVSGAGKETLAEYGFSSP